GRQPDHPIRSIGTTSLDPTARPQLRKPTANVGEPRNELCEIATFNAEPRPINPTNFVILTIAVVVPILAVADFVAREQQRDPVREHEAGQLVAPKLTPQREDRVIARGTFGPTVGAVVVVRAVVIMLAVCLVVLGLVADQVC